MRNYHADNGRFAYNAFVSDVRYKYQGISHCGVNAHHQNGKAEKRICDLQDHARVLIMQACHKWPRAISLHLWQYVIQVEKEARNYLPCTTKGMLLISAFAGNNDVPKISHLHMFGCPTYVNKLQAKRK